MTSFRGFSALIAIAIFLGCYSVSDADVTGTWIMTDQSRQRLTEQYGNATATLTLAADGSFSAIELPGDFLYDHLPSRDGLIAGSGRWSLEGSPGNQSVTLDFLTIIQDGEGRGPYIVYNKVFVQTSLRKSGNITIFYLDEIERGVYFSKIEDVPQTADGKDKKKTG